MLSTTSLWDVIVLNRAAEDDSDDHSRNTVTEQELFWLSKEIPPMPLAVLILCKRDELSYEAAGRVLGISNHMVKKHLSDAIARCTVQANKRSNARTRDTVR